MSLNLRDYQLNAIEMLRQGFAQGHRAQILYLGTGGGKCLGRDTQVVMSDGTTKMVQDVQVGDRLLGPDGAGRTVLSLARGREMLYRVEQVKGQPYVVNESHILSLRLSGPDDLIVLPGQRIKGSGAVVNISVKDYVSTGRTVKHRLKGWRPEAIEFKDVQPTELPLDPYWLGLWLGDGFSLGPAISKPMCNAVQWWIDHAEKNGHGISTSKPGRCPLWSVSQGRNGNKIINNFRKILVDLNLIQNKHIPHIYKVASVQDRLKLLAGLIDTDGHLSHNGYDWISKYEGMARDFAFICKSVGLSANVKECTKGIKTTGFKATYWRVNVSGETDKIPCLDKIASPRLQKKNSLVHGIKVIPIGEGDYYGFELDGDKLFLLGDFTVTHNTETSIAMLEAAKKKGSRSAIILDRVVLCDQTSKRLDRYSIDHGVLQSGHWRYRPHEHIQVCSAQTIEKRGSFPGLTLLVVDECHSKRRQTMEFIKNNPHIKVVGLSASPFTKGLGEVYTNVVSPITTKQLVENGSLVPLRVFVAKEIDMTGAKKVAGEWSEAEASKRGMQITGDIVAEWIKRTHEIFGKPEKTIVFCSGVAHGADLVRKFADQGYNFVSISYKDDDEYKRQVIEDFEQPDSDIIGLVATDVLTKGFDNPLVKIGVSARPFSKSFSSHVQQMGRIMRPAPGKPFALWLCLAKGSLVLTDSGLVPIDKVKITHKIWDGTNFVTHGGAVCNGIQEVITYQGLTATAGHLVHTAEGWRTFGECASQQIRITQTGLGGQAIRLCDDLRPTSFLAGRTAKKIHSRLVRVCDLWVQKFNQPSKSTNWKDKGVQGLQSTRCFVPDVAVQQSSGNACSMLLSDVQSVPGVRRPRSGIQVLWSQAGYALDYGKSWASRVFIYLGSLAHSVGQNRPDWALRAWQSSLAFCGVEPAKQKGEPVCRSDAQVQDGAPGNSILRQHIKAFLLGWHDGGRDCGKVQQALSKAEREVWDILDAGPNNRFTCEGLLVHNCHAGNYIRFQEEWDDLFENGVKELDDEKEKPKKEKKKEEKEAAKCPNCSALWPKGSDTCSHCGHTRERRSMVEAVPGEMEELGGTAGLATRQRFWSMCIYKEWFDKWSRSRSLASYKTKFGTWPKGVDDTPVTPDAAFEKTIKAQIIRYLKGKGRAS